MQCSSEDGRELVAQAQVALELGDIDSAELLMAQALQLAQEDADVLTAFGGMLADVGNVNKAILTLRKAIRLQPDDGFAKYMALGQLLAHTKEAEGMYLRGIELLRNEILNIDESNNGSTGGEGSTYLQRKLSSAICSLVELRASMADNVADILDTSNGLLMEAIALSPSNPEPLQAQASLLHECNQDSAALDALKRSIALWYQDASKESSASTNGKDRILLCRQHLAEEKIQRVERGGQEEQMGPDSSASIELQDQQEGPSYEFRFEACKLLLELDANVDLVVKILESLLAENDRVPHVWHLLALAHYSSANFGDAQEALTSGHKLLSALNIGDADSTALFTELDVRIHEAMGTQLTKKH